MNITDIVLNQDANIIARAPRERLDILTPEIYYAGYDVQDGLVHVRTGDYNGITAANFIDVHGVEHAMTEVLPNAGVFIFNAFVPSDGFTCCALSGVQFPVGAANDWVVLDFLSK